MSAENSGKPLSSGSAPNPVGGAQSVRPDPLDGGEGACCPSPHPTNPSPPPPLALGLDFQPFALPMKNPGHALGTKTESRVGVYLQGADERMRVGVAQQQCQLLAGERLGGIVIRRRWRRLPRHLSDELIQRHTGPPAVAEIRSRTAFTYFQGCITTTPEDSAMRAGEGSRRPFAAAKKVLALGP